MQKKLVIVLGMHRSGTSVLTKGISELGYFVGDKTLPANIANEKGYFEYEELIRLNNHILDELSVRWKTIDLIYINRCETFLNFIEERYYERAYKILENIFEQNDRCVIKDPRISLLMPFWEKVLANMKIKYKYVLAVRNPNEVSKSLVARRDVDFNYGQNLWLYYNTIILKNLKSDILVVNYSDVINDTKKTMYRLCEWLEVDKNSFQERINDFTSTFVEKSLKRQNEEILFDNPVLKQMYDFLNTDSILNSDCKMFIKKQEKHIDMYLNKCLKPFAGRSTKIFIDNGDDSTSESIVVHELESCFEQTINLDLIDFGEINNIRLKLADDDCIIVINEILINNEILDKNWSTNAVYKNGNHHVFMRWCDIYIENIACCIDNLKIKLEIYPIDGYSLSTGYKIKEREIKKLI